MSDIALSIRDRSNGRPRLGRGSLVLALMLVGLVGCQAVPQATPSDAPTGTPADSPAISPDAPIEPTPTPPPAGEDVGARLLAWFIGLGAGSASGPDEVVAYELLEEHSEDSCRQVFETDLPDASETLYRGAAAACLAALHGKSNRWDEADAAYEELGGQPDGCLSRATYDVLEAAVLAHREHPNATFRIDRSATVPLRCPVIEELSVTRAGSGALQISITGDRLGRVIDVGIEFVSDCADATPELGPRTAEFTSNRRSLQATLAADEDSENATLAAVVVVAEPHPWVADTECVEISDSGDPGDEASPSPAP